MSATDSALIHQSYKFNHVNADLSTSRNDAEGYGESPVGNEQPGKPLTEVTLKSLSSC
jgi:hypothetical protein